MTENIWLNLDNINYVQSECILNIIRNSEFTNDDKEVIGNKYLHHHIAEK